MSSCGIAPLKRSREIMESHATEPERKERDARKVRKEREREKRERELYRRQGGRVHRTSRKIMVYRVGGAI